MFSKSPQQRGRIIQSLICDYDYDENIHGKKISKLLEKPVELPQDSHSEHILTRAMERNHKGLIHHCIVGGVALSAPGLLGMTALQKAIEDKQGELARRLINNNVDIYMGDRWADRSMLMLAVGAGDLLTARALMRKGLKINAVTKRGYGCLAAAVESGSPKVVDFVLSHNAPYNVKDGEGYDPIAIAVMNNHHAILEKLLSAGLQPDFSSRLGSRKSLLTLAKEAGGDMHKRVQELKAADQQKKETRSADKKRLPDGWHVTGPQEIANVHTTAALDYQVTEIFNFATGIYTRINRNDRTGAESSAMLDFSQITNREPLEAAAAQLQSVTGQKMDASQQISKRATPNL